MQRPSILALLLLTLAVLHWPSVHAEDTRKPIFKSPDARDAVKAYDDAIRKLQRQFKDAQRTNGTTYVTEAKKIKEEFLAKLEVERKAATQADDLNEAVKLRDAIKQYEATDVSAPGVPVAVDGEEISELTAENERLQAEIKKLKADTGSSKPEFKVDFRDAVIWRRLRAFGIHGTKQAFRTGRAANEVHIYNANNLEHRGLLASIPDDRLVKRFSFTLTFNKAVDADIAGAAFVDATGTSYFPRVERRDKHFGTVHDKAESSLTCGIGQPLHFAIALTKVGNGRPAYTVAINGTQLSQFQLLPKEIGFATLEADVTFSNVKVEFTD